MKVADIPFIKEMLFTTQPVPAQRLMECGVINHVVPREELESCTQEPAKQMVANSPLVLRILKGELRVLTSIAANPTSGITSAGCGRSWEPRKRSLPQPTN
jgi:methylmalonyl-CoA decarboxylase